LCSEFDISGDVSSGGNSSRSSDRLYTSLPESELRFKPIRRFSASEAE
jgi:hypothetical protein